MYPPYKISISMTRNSIVLIFGLFSMLSAFSQGNPYLDSLLSGKNFFVLKDTLASGAITLSPKDSLYYYSFINNFLNRSDGSNKCIDRLFKNYSQQLERISKSRC